MGHTKFRVERVESSRIGPVKAVVAQRLRTDLPLRARASLCGARGGRLDDRSRGCASDTRAAALLRQHRTQRNAHAAFYRRPAECPWGCSAG